ncbi:MAG: hypothetical protein QHH74_08870 [Spirochaetota bacterium]|nr:hypothetical protein [Spirochaetota bacterium]
MELLDIIKNDDDRLFIISPECFIVFTGDSTDDEKPFIRIGNSLLLTPRIIPLIENIIITDLITGNPAWEQYNIDPRYLSSNRYIGSKLIVKRYLEFQKLFGLDLNNATIVDIEQDIPQLSKEQIISDRETFLGVFYTDSNFKILHNQKTMFDLKEIHQKYPGDVLVHSKLSEYSNKPRYAGCGFVITRGATIFYKNNSFSTVGIPSHYYSAFAQLQIDPANIRDVIITNTNSMPLIPLIKWKNAAGGRLRIFYDNDDEIKLLQKLFNQCTLHHKSSKNFVCDNPEGITIQNIASSHNCIITIKNVKPATKDITIVYIHDPSGITQAIETAANLYIIDYEIYKKAAMLCASLSPVIVVDSNREGVPIKDVTYCIPSHQYDVRYYLDEKKLLSDMLSCCSKEFAQAISDEDFDEIEKLLTQELSPHILYNCIQTLRVILHSTTNRDLYKRIEKILYKMQTRPLSDSYRYTIMLHNSYAYMTCQPVQVPQEYPFEAIEQLDEPSRPAPHTLPDICNRIIEDRKRLEMLLDLFYANNTEIAKEAKSIEKAINKRKKESTQTPKLDVSLITKEKLKKRLTVLKKAGIIVAGVAVAILIIVGSYHAFILYQEKQERERQARYIEYLTKKYTIHISDRDIFFYANDVAVKNGYSRIDIKSLKEKNPHWIYPGNRFILLDGEVVIVKPGDTLWGISERKLLTLNITFYTLLDELEKKIDKGIIDEHLAQKAMNAAIHTKHRERVKVLLQKMNELKAKQNNT